MLGNIVEPKDYDWAIPVHPFTQRHKVPEEDRDKMIFQPMQILGHVPMYAKKFKIELWGNKIKKNCLFIKIILQLRSCAGLNCKLERWSPNGKIPCGC